MPTLLHFEDDPMVAAQFARAAEELGLRYRHKPHPDMHIINVVQEEQPDAIIFDVNMPVMDGFNAATRLRKDDRFRALPVVFYSSVDEASHKHRVEELGGTFFSKWSASPKDIVRFLADTIHIA